MSINPKVHFPDIDDAPDISKLKACTHNTSNESVIRSMTFEVRSKFE